MSRAESATWRKKRSISAKRALPVTSTGTSPSVPFSSGRARTDVEAHSRRAREVVEEGDVVGRSGAVGQHPPQRLQPAVQEQAFFGEGTNGSGGQEKQAEEGSHRGRC